MNLWQSGFNLSSFSWLSGIKGDLRYAFRALRRDRAFTMVAILSLALGIGANAAIFTLTDTLLWRELPVRDPERLVVFQNTSRSYFAYSEFAKHLSAALESVLASGGPIAFPIDVGSGPKASYLAEISGNYFEALGVNALMGRLIKPDDDRFTDPKSVVVLSNTFWHRSFDASPSVIGRSIWVNKGRFTVIGIAPPEFFGVSVGEAPDVWIPLSAQPRAFPGTHWLTMRNNNFLTILGRLRPGVTLRRAESILQPVSIEIDIQRNGKPRTAADQRALYESKLVLLPATKGISYLRDQFSKPLHVVFSMVLIVLLLASINVTSLQLARADERHKEISVRLAIGASRFRVVRQLLVESMILACAGSLLGLALCRPSVSALASLMTLWGNEPARLELHFHPNLLTFVLSIAVVVALLSGLLPALYTMRKNLQPGLQQTSLGISTARGSRFAGRLVAALQLAISLVLITGTCLFAMSLHQLRSFDSGIRRERLLQIETDPQAAGYKDRQTVDLNMRLRDRFLHVPGVETVSFTQNGIYAGRKYNTVFRADGFHPSNSDATYATYDHVGPNFFTTLGTPVLAGRDFEDHDNAAAAKVAIINREFARRVFPIGNALGRNIYVDGAPYGIIGVVREIRNDVRRPEPMFYLPQLQTGVQVFSTQFLVRGKGYRRS